MDESLFGSKSPVKSGSAKTLATPNRKASSMSPKRGGAKGTKPPAPEVVLLHRYSWRPQSCISTSQLLAAASAFDCQTHECQPSAVASGLLAAEAQ